MSASLNLFLQPGQRETSFSSSFRRQDSPNIWPHILLTTIPWSIASKLLKRSSEIKIRENYTQSNLDIPSLCLLIRFLYLLVFAQVLLVFSSFFGYLAFLISSFQFVRAGYLGSEQFVLFRFHLYPPFLLKIELQLRVLEPVFFQQLQLFRICQVPIWEFRFCFEPLDSPAWDFFLLIYIIMSDW